MAFSSSEQLPSGEKMPPAICGAESGPPRSASPPATGGPPVRHRGRHGRNESCPRQGPVIRCLFLGYERHGTRLPRTHPFPLPSRARGSGAGWDGPCSGGSLGMGCPLRQNIPCSGASPRTGVGGTPGLGGPQEGASPATGSPLLWDVPRDGGPAAKAASCPACWRPRGPGGTVAGRRLYLSPSVSRGIGRAVPSRAVPLAPRAPAGMRAMPKRQDVGPPGTAGRLPRHGPKIALWQGRPSGCGDGGDGGPGAPGVQPGWGEHGLPPGRLVVPTR